jgi:hypothetical protein
MIVSTSGLNPASSTPASARSSTTAAARSDTRPSSLNVFSGSNTQATGATQFNNYLQPTSGAASTASTSHDQHGAEYQHALAQYEYDLAIYHQQYEQYVQDWNNYWNYAVQNGIDPYAATKPQQAQDVPQYELDMARWNDPADEAYRQWYTDYYNWATQYGGQGVAAASSGRHMADVLGVDTGSSAYPAQEVSATTQSGAAPPPRSLPPSAAPQWVNASAPDPNASLTLPGGGTVKQSDLAWNLNDVDNMVQGQRARNCFMAPLKSLDNNPQHAEMLKNNIRLTEQGVSVSFPDGSTYNLPKEWITKGSDGKPRLKHAQAEGAPFGLQCLEAALAMAHGVNNMGISREAFTRNPSQSFSSAYNSRGPLGFVTQKLWGSQGDDLLVKADTARGFSQMDANVHRDILTSVIKEFEQNPQAGAVNFILYGPNIPADLHQHPVFRGYSNARHALTLESVKTNANGRTIAHVNDPNDPGARAIDLESLLRGVTYANIVRPYS